MLWEITFSFSFPSIPKNDAKHICHSNPHIINSSIKSHMHTNFFRLIVRFCLFHLCLAVINIPYGSLYHHQEQLIDMSTNLKNANFQKKNHWTNQTTQNSSLHLARLNCCLSKIIRSDLPSPKIMPIHLHG